MAGAPCHAIQKKFKVAWLQRQAQLRRRRRVSRPIKHLVEEPVQRDRSRSCRAALEKRDQRTGRAEVIIGKLLAQPANGNERREIDTKPRQYFATAIGHGYGRLRKIVFEVSVAATDPAKIDVEEPLRQVLARIARRVPIRGDRDRWGGRIDRFLPGLTGADRARAHLDARRRRSRCHSPS